MDLKQIGETQYQNNLAKGLECASPEDLRDVGFKGSEFLRAQLAEIHGEVAEATRAIRHGDRTNFAEELADIVIRVASLAQGLGLDLNALTERKLKYNSTRPYNHGY